MKPVKKPGKSIADIKLAELAKVLNHVTDKDLRDARKGIMSVVGVKK